MKLYRLKYLLSRKYISYYEQEKWLETLKKRRDIPVWWFINFRRIRLNCPGREAPEKRIIILHGFEKGLSVEQVNVLVSYSSLPADYLRSIRHQLKEGIDIENIRLPRNH